jgi:hypothetical protein
MALRRIYHDSSNCISSNSNNSKELLVKEKESGIALINGVYFSDGISSYFKKTITLVNNKMTYQNNNLAIEDSQNNIQKTIFSNTRYVRGVYYQNGAVKFFKYQMILFYKKITFYEKENFQIENSKSKSDRKEIKKIKNNSKNEYSSVKNTNSKYLKKLFNLLLYFINNLLISFLKYTFQLIMMLIFAFGYAICFTISFAIKHFSDFIHWASILFTRLLFYALGFVTYQAVCFGITILNIAVSYLIGMMAVLAKFLLIIFIEAFHFGSMATWFGIKSLFKISVITILTVKVVMVELAKILNITFNGLISSAEHGFIRNLFKETISWNFRCMNFFVDTTKKCAFKIKNGSSFTTGILQKGWKMFESSISEMFYYNITSKDLVGIF